MKTSNVKESRDSVNNNVSKMRYLGASKAVQWKSKLRNEKF